VAHRGISALSCLVLCGLCLIASAQARAADIEGVNVEEKIILDGGTPLVLNGAGIRHKFAFLKLYVGALYLPAKKSNAAEIINDAGAKRIAMFVLADEITARELVASLNNSLAANHIPEEMALIEARLRELNRMMVAEGVLKKGAVVTLTYLPATGTHIRINSDEKLVIKGGDFFRALLRIWIGNRPVDGRLRDAMLGGTGSFTLF
jgi:hypothetical protein